MAIVVCLLHTSLKQGLYLIILRWFAKCTDINIIFISGNITPDRGYNLAKVSTVCTPLAQCYSNGARGIFMQEYDSYLV